MAEKSPDVTRPPSQPDEWDRMVKVLDTVMRQDFKTRTVRDEYASRLRQIAAELERRAARI